jgi:hypothetical protein
VIVVPKQHRRFHALAVSGLLVALAAACTDESTPLSPDASPIVASRASTDRTTTGGEADDVLDALDRISPAFGDGPVANQVRGALKDLLEDVSRNDLRGTQRDAAALSQALDRLASLGDPGIGAEIDAVRFVADARK